MQSAFTHTATVILSDGADATAPGAAVTLKLCGSWNHPGPCPLAPHHTTVSRNADELAVRVVFATGLDQEHRVRDLIIDALSSGQLIGPDGHISTWQLISETPADPHPEEQMMAAEWTSHI